MGLGDWLLLLFFFYISFTSLSFLNANKRNIRATGRVEVEKKYIYNVIKTTTLSHVILFNELFAGRFIFFYTLSCFVCVCVCPIELLLITLHCDRLRPNDAWAVSIYIHMCRRRRRCRVVCVFACLTCNKREATSTTCLPTRHQDKRSAHGNKQQQQ